ncbi:MAG TPA: cyanophycinase [Candidatus Angelobacter sp.]|jgi:cyanophycinase|nr:cyanophycinase [Candidatus Angelobacter sp.]
MNKSTAKYFLILLVLLIIAIPLVRAGGGASAKSIGPSKGSLIIVGGGRLGPEIVSRFIELAGGAQANFVVIPTAIGDKVNVDLEKNRFLNAFGVKNFVVLHTRDRSEADSKEFAEPLRHASGVWIEGGRQWRLADAYHGTLTEREIKAVLDRGGVVGGSSAGATIQGSFLVRGASGTPENPDGDNTIMIAPPHIEGFGLLQNAAIDQHVITRHRENDLVPVIDAHPELLGIGIDESTAIVVHGDEFEIIGKSKVGIYDGKDHDGKKYYFLSSGQKFDLKKRKTE